MGNAVESMDLWNAYPKVTKKVTIIKYAGKEYLAHMNIRTLA